MAVSPSRPTLYRRARRVVTLAGAALILLPTISAQAPSKANKGPRALGLLELAPNGKAHLVPVTILFEGKFYDAAAFKAAPVPMVLESGTVYEAVRTGISQGLFTVTGALQARNTWLGDGTWVPAGSAPAKKAPAPAHPPDEDVDAPPVLRREKPKAPEVAPAGTNSQPTTVATTPPAVSAPDMPAPAPAVPTPAEPPPDDSDRPVLRRGKPAPPPKPASGNATAKTSNAVSKEAVSKAADNKPARGAEIQIIPAISDAAGPEPRPYAFSVKPEEEQQFRKKMLELATDEVRARIKLLASEAVGSAKTAARPPQPTFDDIQLRVFDLSNANEPVLVLSATAQIPPTPKAAAASQQFYLTVVARQDLYGDLHKAFSSVTDARHLDALPRMELIDAVDADGDGRGELLFRQVSDAGSAFVVYRVIGNQLWALFQGTPE